MSASPGRPAAVLIAWTPIAVLEVQALVPVLRLPVLVLVPLLAVVAAGAAFALAGARGGRPVGPWAAWVVALPVAVALAWGAIPDPAVAVPGACDDLLAPPVIRRVAQAVVVLGVVAVLTPRFGGPATLGIRMPAVRAATVLAVASPALLPLAIVLGPVIAEPFFGPVKIEVPSPLALVAAVLMAIANGAIEEVNYRGVLLRWGAGPLGGRGALAAQALVFGSAHLGPDQLSGFLLVWTGMILAGLAAGLIALGTRSLLLPFAVHAVLDVPLALAKTCRFA